MTIDIVSLYEKAESGSAPTTTREIAATRNEAPLPDRVDKHPAGAYLMTAQTAMSRETVISALNTVVRLLGQKDIKSTPWHRIGYLEMNVLRSMLAEHYAPATANKVLSIGRGVLRQAWKLKLMTTDDYERAAAVQAIRGSRMPAGRALERGEIYALFQTCAAPGALAARDAAVFAILLGCGLRRSEARSLDLENLDTTTATLRVIGKGNHERIAHMNGNVTTAVTAWIGTRGEWPGPLLCGMEGKAERLNRKRLTTEAIRLILKRRAAQAGLRSCTPHDLRRTFITMLLDEGNDIAVAARMAGHKNVSTTTRYDRRGEETSRNAARTIHIPYQGPTNKTREAAN